MGTVGRSVARGACLGAVLAAAVAGTSSAATIVVSATSDDLTAHDGGCSLREAISTVDGHPNGDCAAASASGPNTIVLGPHRYPLTLSGVLTRGNPSGCISTYVPARDDNTAGELSVFASVHGLTIRGAGPRKTVIDACKLGDRVFEIKPGATVWIRGLTITNGHARNGAPAMDGQLIGSTGGDGNMGAEGGGILNEGTLALIDAALTNNRAGNGSDGGAGGDFGGSGGGGASGSCGGAISNETGQLTVIDSTLSGNYAGNGGNGGKPTEGSTTDGQSGNGGAGGDGAEGGCGGGIWNIGKLTVTGSTIAANHAGAGGAGSDGQQADPVNGGAGGNGGNGGLGGFGGGIESDTPITATNDTIYANTAGNAGKGGAGGAEVNGLEPNGIGGNGGNGGGVGGISSYGGTLLNLTIAANAAGAGGSAGTSPDQHGTAGADGDGGGVSSSSFNPTTIRNTLLYKNQRGDCAGTISDGGHNLVFALPSGGSSSCDVSHFVTADPVLGTLSFNGGPTETMRLGAGSAARDQIPASGAGCPATDQRGVRRPGGSKCDIGAYEVRSPVVRTPHTRAVGKHHATIGDTVIAEQLVATVYVQYGTSTRYGNKTAVKRAFGVAATLLSWVLDGLKAHTTIHFRVVAQSSDGTTIGPDRTFKTS